MVREYNLRRTTDKIAKGKVLRTGRIKTNVVFPVELFNQIKAEARQRKWPFSRMVRELCEASIEGIE